MRCSPSWQMSVLHFLKAAGQILWYIESSVKTAMFDRGQCQPHYRAKEGDAHACVCISTTATPSLAQSTPGASLSLQLLSDCFYRSFSNTDQALVPHIHNGQYLIDNRVDQIPLGTGQHTCHWWLPHKRKGKFKIGWWTKNLYSLWKAPQNGSLQTVWWPLNV